MAKKVNNSSDKEENSNYTLKLFIKVYLIYNEVSKLNQKYNN